MKKFITLTLFLVSVLSQAYANVTETIIVDAKTNIFVAGGNATLNPNRGDMNGIPPKEISFLPQVGQILMFSSITGEATCGEGGTFYGPDGGFCSDGNTDIFSFNGISGILHKNKTLFLVGIFLDDSQPVSPAPPRLDFTEAEGIVEIAPQLNQVFFIGDGLTGNGSGTIQKFHIPNTATRFFLGFADGWNFDGVPGYYEDNSGQVEVSLEIIQKTVTQSELDNARQEGIQQCVNNPKSCGLTFFGSREPSFTPFCNDNECGEVWALPPEPDDTQGYIPIDRLRPDDANLWKNPLRFQVQGKFPNSFEPGWYRNAVEGFFQIRYACEASWYSGAKDLSWVPANVVGAIEYCVYPENIQEVVNHLQAVTNKLACENNLPECNQ